MSPESAAWTGPSRPDPSAGSARRGWARWEWVLVAALVLGALGLVLALAPGPHPVDAALAAFLEEGPAGGSWEVRRLATTQQLKVLPDAGRPDLVRIQVAHPGASEGREQVVSRWLVVRNFFFEAPADLFFRNYERQGAPEPETLEGLGAALKAVWVPRRPTDTLTQRRAWFRPGTHEVLQIEDVGREGRSVRRVRRIPEAQPWDPHLDLLELERCDQPPPEGRGAGDDLRSLAARAPFALYAPAWLPPGFEPIRLTYQECELSRALLGGPEADDPTPVRVASLTYSDGLAILSVGIAVPRDMDALEALQRMSRMQEDPDACPGLPAPTGPLPSGRAVVRLRTDACRTVMRRDDLPGVSVTLTGRNEVPLDDYLAVIESLEPIQGDALPAGGKRPN